MDKDEFLYATDKVSKFIVEYLDNVGDENVLPKVQPGFLAPITEKQCPQEGASFDEIFAEFGEKIMPGVTHWASPHFHAYFTAGNCFASMVGELLIAGLNNIGITWEASPAMNELEIVVLNWLGKMMDLPAEFLNSSEGPGGGVLQNTSTESTLLSLIVARNRAIQRSRPLLPHLTDGEIAEKLVAYASQQSHSSVERVGLMTGLTTRFLPYDEAGFLTRQVLVDAVEADLAQGRIPCFLVATMGATTTCSWDDLTELGSVCEQHDIWMHVDAAYCGAALTCPELRYISRGLHYASSFAVGLHKWFLMSFDVVAYWLKDTTGLSEALRVDRIYLQHSRRRTMDFTHMQIGNGRKFKALKVWMTLKSFGVRGVQEHIRRHVTLGQYMQTLMRQDQRFQVVTAGFGLVGFALTAGDKQTQELRELLNDDKRLMLTPCHFRERYVIRFVVNFSTRSKDVQYAWNVIRKTADRVAEVQRKADFTELLTETFNAIPPNITLPTI